MPNSILHARPVCLVREKETRESVSEHFKPYMDKLAEIEMGLVPITSESSAQVVTELSMMDGKMVDIVQGDSGAFCHYCNATRADANDLTKINNRFRIEKSADKCLEIWESIESGEMSYSDKERKRQEHKPFYQYNVTITTTLTNTTTTTTFTNTTTTTTFTNTTTAFTKKF